MFASSTTFSNAVLFTAIVEINESELATIIGDN